MQVHSLVASIDGFLFAMSLQKVVEMIGRHSQKIVSSIATEGNRLGRFVVVDSCCHVVAFLALRDPNGIVGCTPSGAISILVWAITQAELMTQWLHPGKME